MNRRWTTRDDERLRALYGQLPARAIGAVLRRGTCAVQRRASILGLASGRHYSAEEKALIRRDYPTTDGVELAKRLGRSATSLHRCAARLGIRKLPRVAPELLDRVRELHAEGLHDMDISRRLGMNRRTVTYLRRKRLGLSPNQAAILEAMRRGIKAQRATLGIRTSGELRTVANRRFAESRGWPGYLRPRHVQILELLAIAGKSLTKRAIAKAIGTSPDADLRASRHVLKGNGRSSLLGDLANFGLVLRLRRAHRRPGAGKGTTCDLYTLTPAAIEIVIQRSRTCPRKETA